MSAFEVVLAILICWNLTALIVVDNVFAGSRSTVVGWLDRTIGTLSNTAQHPGGRGLLRVEMILVNRARVRYVDRRRRLAPTIERATSNLADSRDQEAIISTAWWWLVQHAALSAGTLLFPHHFPPFVARKVFSLFRLLVQKLHEGLQCPFCVSVWVAVPSVALACWEWPSWRVAAIGGLAASAGARLLFHLTVLATKTREHLRSLHGQG